MRVIYQDSNQTLREAVFSEAEIKAVETDVADFCEWHENVGRSMCRYGTDKIVTLSGQGSRNTEHTHKLAIVEQVNVESAADRKTRIAAERAIDGTLQSL